MIDSSTSKKRNGEGLTLSVPVGVDFLDNDIVVSIFLRLLFLTASQHDQVGYDNLVAPATVSVFAGPLP